MEIIVEILIRNGKAGTYKLYNANNKYKWVYIWIRDRHQLSSRMTQTLSKNIKERYNDELGYYFDFEEGDLERLR